MSSASDPPSHLKVMSFGEHLEELRRRLGRSLLVTIFFALIALLFQSTLMELISAPHQRAMRQVQGRRLAAELDERLAKLREQMSGIGLYAGAAAIANEEDEAERLANLNAIAAERSGEEPLAAALLELLVDRRGESVTGAKISNLAGKIRADLTVAKTDHAWGAGDPIDGALRDLDGIDANLKLWRAEAAEPSRARTEADEEEALKALYLVDGELTQLAVLSDRLRHWQRELVPLKLLSYVEAFFSHLKLAFLVGLLCGLPWITYEIWMFIAAGLYEHERAAVRPFLPFSFIGLLAGGMFAYHVLIPVGLSYLGGYGDPDLFDPSFTLTNYMGIVFTLLIGMGLVFQLPLVMIFLSRSGMVTPEKFREVRKYSILGALILGAFLTPPDVVTQLLMAGPLVILYETGIYASLYFRRRAEKAAEAGSEPPASDRSA